MNETTNRFLIGSFGELLPMKMATDPRKGKIDLWLQELVNATAAQRWITQPYAQIIEIYSTIDDQAMGNSPGFCFSSIGEIISVCFSPFFLPAFV